MANTLAARSRAPSASLVTHTGRLTATRGAGRPASSAALLIDGTMCDSTVAGPVIQVVVPSASEPASFSIVGARAATSTGGAGAFTSSGAIVAALSVSPS